MKKLYKISEISRLFGICTDSLRYYEEKGILSPKRDDNGYRIYDLKNIWKLNVIKNLRELGFSSMKIKEYLEDRNLKNTLLLLNEEVDIVSKKLEELKDTKKKLLQKMKQITICQSSEELKVMLKTLPSRKSYIIDRDVVQDFEIDYLFNKVTLESSNYFDIIGNENYGAYVNPNQIGQYTSVFISSDNIINPSHSISGGDYLCTYYRGNYSNYHLAIKSIKEYAAEHNIILTGEIIEIFHVDIHETKYKEEFITEVQVLIQNK